MLEIGSKIKLSPSYRRDGIQPEGLIIALREDESYLVYWTDRKGTDQSDGKYCPYHLKELPDTRRPHYDLIIAWANGATIQRRTSSGVWLNQLKPQWDPEATYRVKSEKQDKLDSLRDKRDELDIQIRVLELELTP